MIDYSATVTMFCEANDLPQPVSEYRFAKAYNGRKWEMDFCWPDYLLALEVEGAIWKPGGGRHNRGAGMIEDMLKYNTAAIIGYRLLRYTPQQLRAGEWVTDVKAALAARERGR